jgi:hypothetical protein
MDAISTLRLRDAEHLHRCGPRCIAGFLAEIAEHCGQTSFILDRLADYARIEPELLRAVGADRFPRSIRLVDPS